MVQLDNVRVVAVSDPLPEKAAIRANKFGIDAEFAEVEQMLDSVNPDALDIASPVGTHATIARMAAERGIAILCQKPVTETLDEAEFPQGGRGNRSVYGARELALPHALPYGSSLDTRRSHRHRTSLFDHHRELRTDRNRRRGCASAYAATVFHDHAAPVDLRGPDSSLGPCAYTLRRTQCRCGERNLHDQCRPRRRPRNYTIAR